VSATVLATKARPSIRSTKSAAGTGAELKWPWSLLVTLVVCPVVRLVINILAPLIVPPFEEETVPVMTPVATSCAAAPASKTADVNNAQKKHFARGRVKHNFPDTILMGKF
jgi:hypothetical protein